MAVLLGWAAGHETPSLRAGLAAMAIAAAVVLVFAARHSRLRKPLEALARNAPFSMAPKIN